MAEDLEQRIFAKVKARTPAAKDLSIRSVQAMFLVGGLYTIGWKLEDPQANPDGYVNRACVRGRNVGIFGNDAQLLAIVGSTHGNAFSSRLSDPCVVSSGRASNSRETSRT